MKNILIVEDEKLIRKGIVKMIERSEVEYQTLFQANNGIKALEVLKENEIDLVLTDIKMPKMDGVELVSKISDFPNPPYIVTISGFDDFEYAVTMLRNGVKEYLLKPVEREKLIQVLKVIDQEIKNKIADLHSEKAIVAQQLKYLILNDNISNEEKDVIFQKFSSSLFEHYKVICGVRDTLKQIDESIFLDRVDIFDLMIYPSEMEEKIININYHKFLGISKQHQGIENLKQAVDEAISARKIAFFYNINFCYFDRTFNKATPLDHNYIFNEDLMDQAAKLIGVNKIDETLRIIKFLASDGKSGKISLNKFESLIKILLNNIIKSYQNIIDLNSDELKKYQVIYDRLCLDDYIMEMNNWIINLHNTISIQYDDYKNKKKIMDAIDFIDNNYNKDINMAVVSNQVSMNYSLFSLSFKQYTGVGFNIYLRNYRIDKAKKLLETTDLKVKEIAFLVGFSNEKLFMKNFKIVTNMSAGEYRKNLAYSE